MNEEKRLEAAIKAGAGRKHPDEFKWTLDGGFVVGFFYGVGLGARASNGSVIHVEDRALRAMLADHPALEAADAMDATDRRARWVQGKTLAAINR